MIFLEICYFPRQNNLLLEFKAFSRSTSCWWSFLFVQSLIRSHSSFSGHQDVLLMRSALYCVYFIPRAISSVYEQKECGMYLMSKFLSSLLACNTTFIRELSTSEGKTSSFLTWSTKFPHNTTQYICRFGSFVYLQQFCVWLISNPDNLTCIFEARGQKGSSNYQTCLLGAEVARWTTSLSPLGIVIFGYHPNIPSSRSKQTSGTATSFVCTRKLRSPSIRYYYFFLTPSSTKASDIWRRSCPSSSSG